MAYSNHLLTVAEIGRADRLAIDAGTPGITLMRRAGAGLASVIRRGYPLGAVLVACGPGNNGGDGFIAARILAEAGWPVRLALLGDVKGLGGDAALAAKAWSGPIEPLTPEVLDGQNLLVDAIFGAGLSKPISGTVATFVEAANRRIDQGTLTSIAVDMPSGVDGDTGSVKGCAIQAADTVTFFRRKPGHLLMPGRSLSGRVHVVDIGIEAAVLDEIKPSHFANHPGNWRSEIPQISAAGHKYSRGHALIYGGAEMTGAARLAASAARRIGAGLVSVTAPQSVFDVYAADEPGVIVRSCDDIASFDEIIGDPRKNAILVGPGAGVETKTAEIAVRCLNTGRAVVLDADALTCFTGNLSELTAAITGPAVLTPHDGEFNRLFGDMLDPSAGKAQKAAKAAAETGAVIVLKGPDTVIARPDGVVTLNENAPPSLASGGTGDILAGLIVGLLAQGMPVGAAATAGVWLHGQAARQRDGALIAEDLPVEAGRVLHHIKAKCPIQPTHRRLPLIERVI